LEIKSAYRLGTYRIMEYETGQLWWETHADFGVKRGGECLVSGNILIIKPWSSEKTGPLIGEFLDQIKKLPPWDKTLYWCFSANLLNVRTGKKLKDGFLKLMTSRVNSLKGKRDKGVQGSFNLHGHRITCLDDGSISWQAAGNNQTIIGGMGRIESDILFLGPAQGEEIKGTRKEFHGQLSRLPDWTGSSAWCRCSPLTNCREKPTPIRSFREIFRENQKNTIKDEVVEKIPAPRNSNQLKSGKEIGTPGALPLKAPWAHFSMNGLSKMVQSAKPFFSVKKIFIAGFVLILSGLILGISLSVHFFKDLIHRFPQHEKHHHSRARGISGIFLVVLLVAGGSPNGVLGAEEKGFILKESGIHYPGGFDPNTVGEVRGKAVHFWKPEKGPVRFKLVTGYETYIVLTCPPWYWDFQPVRIPEGSAVSVRGSKSVGRDGKLYIIAMEIQILSSGRLLPFRGKDGIPLWKTIIKPVRETLGGPGSSATGPGSWNNADRPQGR
jgi:hypothetical protein